MAQGRPGSSDDAARGSIAPLGAEPGAGRPGRRDLASGGSETATVRVEAAARKRIGRSAELTEVGRVRRELDLTAKQVVDTMRNVEPEPIRDHLVEIVDKEFPPEQVLFRGSPGAIRAWPLARPWPSGPGAP